MAYNPMRDYVLKLAQDKRQSLLITLKDQLNAELVDPELFDNKAIDIDAIVLSYQSLFNKIDELVEQYVVGVTLHGGDRNVALHIAAQILEVDV